MINEWKQSNEKGERRDLLSNLVSANEELLDDGAQRLGEEELIGTGQTRSTGTLVQMIVVQETCSCSTLLDTR
jgi:hypothetical protein